MISILFVLSFVLSVLGTNTTNTTTNNTLYSFGNQSINAESLSLAYTGNNMILLYYDVDVSAFTSEAFYQYINLTSGKIVQNYTGAQTIQNLVWINNTQEFVCTFTVNGSERLGVWNFTQEKPLNSYELVKYSVGGDGNFYVTQLYNQIKYVLSGEYIFNDTGSMFIQLEVINLKTGDQVYVDQDTKMNFIMGVAASANRYTYIGLSGGFAQTRISHLKTINPKTKELVLDMQIVQSEGYESPHFYSVSEFKSIKNGNYLGVTLSNQTLILVDTLRGTTISSIKLDFQEHLTPVCKTINDEVDVMFYCYVAENKEFIKIYRGSQNITKIAELIEKEEIYTFASQPEKERILYGTASGIKYWSYAANQTEIVD